MQKQKLTLSLFNELTTFQFTLFGLPFIFAGAFLPGELLLSWRYLWLIPAFLAGRVSGMAFNQLIDRKIDEVNPRTANRAIPSGRATVWQARAIAWSSLALFLIICFLINPLCALLAPLAAFLIYIYSYTKRVSFLCHFTLGSIHFLGPVMASIAISGGWVWQSCFLGLAAAFSVAGNDMVYAFQDFDFDKSHHVHSAPATFGLKGALKLSQITHVGCLVSLLCLGIFSSFSWLYFIGPLLAGLVLLDFHVKVKPLVDSPEETKRVMPLFFKSNVTVALIALFSVIVGVLCKG